MCTNHSFVVVFFPGHKGSVFRGGVSTTAIIHSKLVAEEKRGKSFKGNVHITDWLPTLMGIATNGKWQGSLTGADIDGQDVWNAILSGKKLTQDINKTVTHHILLSACLYCTIS